MYAVSTAHIATLLALYDRDPNALSVATVLNDSAALSHPQDSRLVVVALYLPIINVSSAFAAYLLRILAGLITSCLVHTIRCRCGVESMDPLFSNTICLVHPRCISRGQYRYVFPSAFYVVAYNPRFDHCSRSHCGRSLRHQDCGILHQRDRKSSQFWRCR